MSIWVISDLHFGHKNIIRHERQQFVSIEEHDEFIIKALNYYVKPTDILYILGDIGNVELVPKINGRKFLIRGNHDKRDKIVYLGYFIEVYDTPVYIAKNIVLSHEPIMVNDHIYNVHGHLHTAVLDSKNHLNLSIHQADYKPLELDTLKYMASKLPKEQAAFLQEWYADLYRFTQPKADVVMDSRGRILLKESKQLRESLYKKAE